MTLKLTENVAKFIEEQVTSGGYASAQDVVCAGLGLLGMPAASTEGNFKPGEWDRLLAEAEGTEAMALEDVVSKRRWLRNEH